MICNMSVISGAARSGVKGESVETDSAFRLCENPSGSVSRWNKDLGAGGRPGDVIEGPQR